TVECCPMPPPPPMCIKETLKSMMCQDQAAWKREADKFCASKKMVLTAISFGRSCAMGTPTWNEATVGCGTKGPPPPMGTTGSEASMMCVDAVAWTRAAQAACTAKMMLISKISFEKPCPGGFNAMTYECCPGAPPPPPMCIKENLKSMMCQD